MSDAFEQWGSDEPASPVVLSVPHAGRDYPPALVAALRVPAAALRGLEDRYVDAVALAARGTETMLVQRRARAWIDLNRGEDERDPQVDAGAVAATARPDLRVAINAPYAGGHVVERHGAPRRGVHAVQLELDRALYLDADGDRPGAGLAATAALVRAVIDALADEAVRGAAPLAIAAE